MWPFMSIFISAYNVSITQSGTQDKLMKMTTHISQRSKQVHIFIYFQEETSLCLYKKESLLEIYYLWSQNQAQSFSGYWQLRGGDCFTLTQGQGDIHISLLLLCWYNYWLHSHSFSKVASIDNCTPSRQLWYVCFSRDLDSITTQRLWFLWLGMWPTDLHFKKWS